MVRAQDAHKIFRLERTGCGKAIAHYEPHWFHFFFFFTKEDGGGGRGGGVHRNPAAPPTDDE